MKYFWLLLIAFEAQAFNFASEHECKQYRETYKQSNSEPHKMHWKIRWDDRSCDRHAHKLGLGIDGVPPHQQQPSQPQLPTKNQCEDFVREYLKYSINNSAHSISIRNAAKNLFDAGQCASRFNLSLTGGTGSQTQGGNTTGGNNQNNNSSYTPPPPPPDPVSAGVDCQGLKAEFENLKNVRTEEALKRKKQIAMILKKNCGLNVGSNVTNGGGNQGGNGGGPGGFRGRPPRVNNNRPNPKHNNHNQINQNNNGQIFRAFPGQSMDSVVPSTQRRSN